MTYATIMTALLWGVIFGGLASAIVFLQAGRSVVVGIGAGAVVGALGAQILLAPLQHCPFTVGEDGLVLSTYIAGVVLAITSSLLLLVPLWMWANHSPLRVRELSADDRRAVLGRRGDWASVPLPDFILLVSSSLLLSSFGFMPWLANVESGLALSGLQLLEIAEGFTATHSVLWLSFAALALVSVGALVASWRVRLARIAALLSLAVIALYFLPVIQASMGNEPTQAIRIGFVLGAVSIILMVVQGVLPRRDKPDGLLPYVFLVPKLIILLFFLYYPMVNVILLSFQRSRLGLNARFVCTDNYERLVTDSRYLSSFSVTMTLTLSIVILGMGLALIIAVLASQKIRGASVYRTLLIWPYALSPVVTGMIFLIMFNPQVGVVNYFLYETFGIRPNWFSDASLAPWVIILASVWNNLGFNILFYVAGLQSVPDDLLEAASIDGANMIQRFVRITFPLLSPYTFFLLITNVTYAFYGIFGSVDALTQGGPRGATRVLIYKLYEDAFTNRNTGSASAQSLVLFLIVAIMTVIQFRFIERRVTYGD